MNEQIRTLAEQAGMCKMNQRSDGFFVVDEKVFEKFAELIVQECSEFVEQDQGSGEALSRRLKEHFGVEQ